MRHEPGDEAYLWDMLKAARRAMGYIDGFTYESFVADQRTYDAIERVLEIVGQAAKEVSQEFKDRHHHIDWRGIIGLRNMLAHEYGEIIQERIWRVTQVYIPNLIAKLEPLLDDKPM